MSVDGGGTKLLAILFDDRLNLCGQGRGGPINPNFDSMEDIKATMMECIGQCLSGQTNIQIERVYISMPGPSNLFIKLLQNVVEVLEYFILSEGYMSLLAGLQCKRGMVALAGTGSGVFWIDGAEEKHIGGWGSLLGDEGSAYDIGRKGLIAAIKAYEGRGEKTSLQDLISKEWRLDSMWNLVHKVYGVPSARVNIASTAPLVSKAALMGDRVALQIFDEAGMEMAVQTLALLSRVSVQSSIFITISGGAWKGCSRMLDQFEKVVKSTYPKIHIKIPIFEPVMGGIIAEGLTGREKMCNESLNKVIKEYQTFLYNYKS